MVASGEPVRDGGTTRPVQYEDCCVLLAARGDFPAYAEALTARGIPVYADARENLLDADVYKRQEKSRCCQAGKLYKFGSEKL